ncbi:hypothetical protein ARMGADRAFT_1020268 [Armillaria gallica]|uniref:Uncharacterized protein n=1 Tax=Armillaria gallica TaxID=47427 RepID=A0A2H3CEM3_ARMGA|nr:hypothetical protein ARMGADRAFT_1020268 [Armillaria gallica]
MPRHHLGLIDFPSQTHIQPLPIAHDDLSHKGRRTPRRIATKGNVETEGTRRGTSPLSIPPQSSPILCSRHLHGSEIETGMADWLARF